MTKMGSFSDKKKSLNLRKTGKKNVEQILILLVFLPQRPKDTKKFLDNNYPSCLSDFVAMNGIEKNLREIVGIARP